jgi:hypothetical protein
MTMTKETKEQERSNDDSPVWPTGTIEATKEDDDVAFFCLLCCFYQFQNTASICKEMPTNIRKTKRDDGHKTI